jgi:GR25 family glycosyltransferase involved in LPS biosynthesis
VGVVDADAHHVAFASGDFSERVCDQNGQLEPQKGLRMDKVKGPYVINLDHRTDRWAEVQGEFAKLGVTPVRIPAVYTPGDGSTGCLASHILTLDLSDNVGCPVVWVCEDDVTFTVNKDAINMYINEFLKSDADVLCLGFSSYKHLEYNDLFYRTIDCQTTSCYVIKQSAIKELRNLWVAVHRCRLTGEKHPYEKMYKAMKIHNPDFYWIDQCWKILQQKYKFLIPKVRCAYQREGFSDIEGRVVNHRC